MPVRTAIMIAVCLTLLPAMAWARGAFDGNWEVTLRCSTEPGGALGYTFVFPARVTDNTIMGEHGGRGQPDWLTIEGPIHVNGTATLLANGLTGTPLYTLKHVNRGTPYQYHINAQFGDRQGTGHRVEGRECTYSFVKL